MQTIHRVFFCTIIAALAPLAACDDGASTDGPAASGGAARATTSSTLAVKAYIADNLDELVAASEALQAAAPAPDADGWGEADRAKIEETRAAWRRARVAYEHVEGAIAVLFPELDASTDERYDGFLAGGRDDDLFDGEGVTGIHAIERVLWAPEVPARVVTFESALAGYGEARFPRGEREAAAFRDELCARLVADARRMRDEFRGVALDGAAAFRGVIGSVEEQREKIEKAESGEEESRYAQHTLADMRANVEGGKRIYQAFSAELRAKGDDGKALDGAILEGLDELSRAYDEIEGDALPAPPGGFDYERALSTEQSSPFGKLYATVKRASDAGDPGSLAANMARAADLLGLPVLP